MEFYTDLSQLNRKEKTAVTLGKFDGLHLGHKKLLKQVQKEQAAGKTAAVFTFDIPPSCVLDGRTSGVLLTNDERRDFLARMGMDILVQCPFTKEVASIEPEEFVRRILLERMNAGFIVVGTDFRFGYKRRGDIALLKEMSEQYGFSLMVMEKEQYCGEDISSTYIRKMLREGKMEQAADMLGYPYFLTGTIVKGKQLGRTIGVPTANIIPDAKKLLPPNGVYASRIQIGREWYCGMTNIGFRPTVETEGEKNAETFLFNFDREIYGEYAVVELLAYERPERRFPSLSELTRQLQKDMEATKERLDFRSSEE